MPLLERTVDPEPRSGTERSFELRLGSLGGFEVRPTRLFVWKGPQRDGSQRVLPLAERPVGLDRARVESTIRIGGVELRSRGNPALTLAIAGAVAVKRWTGGRPASRQSS
jgi:hypothetical protein